MDIYGNKPTPINVPRGIDTSCKKCRASAPPLEIPVSPSQGVIGMIPMTMTGYRCPNCGHYNDLKKRQKRQ